MSNERKIKLIRLHKNLKLLCIKEYYQESEKTSYEMRNFSQILYLIKV